MRSDLCKGVRVPLVIMFAQSPSRVEWCVRGKYVPVKKRLRIVSDWTRRAAAKRSCFTDSAFEAFELRPCRPGFPLQVQNSSFRGDASWCT